MKTTDNKQTRLRLAALRKWMKQNEVAACIIADADPHGSEYVEDHYKARSYFSGFDGSAGLLAVSLKSAGLWTDSRYYIQAEIQLKDTGITLYKEGLPGTTTIADWLRAEAGEEPVAGDEESFAHKFWDDLTWNLDMNDLPSFLDLWTDRPPKVMSKVFVHEEKYSGRSAGEKLAAVRKEMASADVEMLLATNLDDIAWLMNIRASNPSHDPVARAFAIIQKDACTLFIDEERLSPEAAAYLKAQGVKTAPYDDFYDRVDSLTWQVESIAIDENRINEMAFENIFAMSGRLDAPNMISGLRAVKNETEIEGYHRAMERDGVVWTKFLRWFYEMKDRGESFTELDVAAKLRELKGMQPLFVDESFDTIAGYAEHGAIGHYTANAESNAEIAGRSLLVIDSGTHYLDGTTDITRTLACGELTEEEMTDYTLVLKGHIALARAVFPRGTKGSQLDVLARQFLWQNLRNYGHGTGHGVGHLLNVHEGYAWLRPRENGAGYEPGLTMTDEPGIYREGKHGVRIENTVLVTELAESEFGSFLQFETLTLCPIDLAPVKAELLTVNEKQWIRSYHEMTLRRISPLLDEDDARWLEQYMRDAEKKLD